MRSSKKYIFLLICFLLKEYAVLGNDVVQYHNNEIVLGQTASLSGHLGVYGRTIKNAINAYFDFTNKHGGINGKKIRLESLDDGGDPEIAVENIKKLQKRGIEIFIGCTGVRSILAVLPLVEKKSIVMLFPWAGHEKFRDPNLTYMINGLGYLKPQLEALVHEMVHIKKIKRIGIFCADDDFSVQAAQDLELLLQHEGIQPLITVSYNRFTVDTTAAVTKLIKKDPKGIISVGTSIPTINMIDSFWSQGYYNTVFMGIDSTLFVNTLLRSRNVPFSYTSPVPDPTTSQVPLAQEYRKQISLYAPEETYNILSFSYFLSAAIVADAYRRCDKNCSKAMLIDALEKLKDTLLSGIPISFDPHDRHLFGKKIFIIER